MADLGRALDDIWAGRPLAERPRARVNGSATARPGSAERRDHRRRLRRASASRSPLKKAGIDSLTIFEKADGVGGVWRDNTYPGAACDVPSHLYSFSFEPNPDWSRRYSPQPEILDYLERCVEKYGLRPSLRLGTEVTRAEFDDESGEVADRDRWRRDGRGGRARLRLRPAQPPGDGADPRRRPLQGPDLPHRRWDHDVEIEGKRVAVIGTGASTIQVVPAIAERVAQLDVYQRSAPYVIPKKDRPYMPWERRLFRWFPPARLAGPLHPVAHLRDLHLRLQPVPAAWAGSACGCSSATSTTRSPTRS